MHIIVDELTPYAEEAFSTLGTVQTCPGQAITAQTVKNADILIVRSVTRINAELIANSPVRLVASATAGLDHVDTDYLSQAGIKLVAAPGSNACSVAEWLITVLLEWRLKNSWSADLPLSGLTIGIIGVGAVGTAVQSLVSNLGATTLLNDPPREQRGDQLDFVSLDQLLAQSQIVTLHTPLTKMPQSNPTEQMAGTSFFQKMTGTVFINAARGECCSESALRSAIKDGQINYCALDVFQNEPTPAIETLDLVNIVTPHIAGHSAEAKIRGTKMIYDAICTFLQCRPSWEQPIPPVKTIDLHTLTTDNPATIVLAALRACLDLSADSAELRQLRKSGHGFNNMRARYQSRREFASCQILLPSHCPEPAAKCLSLLGFLL